MKKLKNIKNEICNILQKFDSSGVWGLSGDKFLPKFNSAGDGCLLVRICYQVQLLWSWMSSGTNLLPKYNSSGRIFLFSLIFYIFHSTALVVLFTIVVKIIFSIISFIFPINVLLLLLICFL